MRKNNEILGTAKTDAEGRATFNPGLTRGEGGMAPAVLMAAKGDEDFVFLDMTKAGFDLSDRGVAGRAAPGALDVYAWTERGIYRAGETVHVAALARDAAANAVENLPLTFIFSRPDGVEDRRIVVGRRVGRRPCRRSRRCRPPPCAAPGRSRSIPTRRSRRRQPDVPGRGFRAGPDRVRPDRRHARDRAGETANVTVDGRFLYGAPAAGLALEGEVTLSTKRQWDSFKGYYFGLADEQEGEANRMPLTGLPLVGDDGKATLPGPDRPVARRRRGCSTPPSRCACAKPAAAPSSARSTSPSRPKAT